MQYPNQLRESAKLQREYQLGISLAQEGEGALTNKSRSALEPERIESFFELPVIRRFQFQGTDIGPIRGFPASFPSGCWHGY